MDVFSSILPFTLIFLLKYIADSMNRTIIDITDQLPKGAGTYGSRNLSQIERFVIHHSATSSGSPELYAKHHIEKNGWPGIGYHFVIQKDGTIYQTNRLQTISYNVGGYNTGSVGICLTGNYEVETPPAAQMDSLLWLLRKLAGELGPYPIYPHRQFSETKCPGDNLDIQYIRAKVYPG